MKFLLVSPRSSEKKSPVGFRIPQLALHILAGLTPDDVDLTIVDEQMSEVDFSQDYDLVGISIMTATSKRGYEIARIFKEKGSAIVFGGIHASVMPEEAIKHGNAVVIGEAETSWPILVKDFRNNKLKKFYRAAPADLSKAPLPKRDIKVDRHVMGYNWPGFYTTRGCPYNCEFCSVSDIYGRKIRNMPVAQVVRDIKNAKSKFFLLLDDNVVGNPKYAKDMFRQLAPLKIEWGGQSTVSIARDPTLLDLCHESGCRGLFIGLESVSKVSAGRMHKTLKSLAENEDAIKKIQDAGIICHPSFVFGLDDDTRGIFDDTLDFLRRNKITTATFNVLTPYPGTRLHQRLKREGRLISEDWSRYNHSTVVFRPKNMTARELAEGYYYFKKEFYSWDKMCRRISRLSEVAHPGLAQFFYAVFNNLAGKQTLIESYKAVQMLS